MIETRLNDMKLIFGCKNIATALAPLTRPKHSSQFLSMLMVLLIAILCSCSQQSASAEDAAVLTSKTEETTSCPRERTLQGLPEGTDAIHLDLDYWVDTWASQVELDERLLTETEIESHRHSIAAELLPDGVEGELRAQLDLSAAVDPAKITESLKGRLSYLKGLIEKGSLVTWSGKALSEDELNAFSEEAHQLIEPTLHIALDEIQLRCAPYRGQLKRLDADLSIDRNACTRVKPQAPLQLLAESPDGLKLVRTRLAIGWISGSDLISESLGQRQAKDYLGSRFVYQPRDHTEEARRFQELTSRLGASLSPLGGTRFPIVSRGLQEENAPPEKETVWIATKNEIREITLEELSLDPKTMLTSQRPFTRREVLRELFSMLNQPYGLGGSQGGVDCSRMVVNALEPFGLNPPRYSGHQAYMGTFGIDLSAVKSERERLNLLNAAFKRGLVLIYLPGHIGIYMGPDQEGVPRFFHAFADYQELCEGGEGETQVRVNKVAVTDLFRGEGSSKGSYLSRATRIVIIGGTPGASLEAVSALRLPAKINQPERNRCKRTKNRARIFTSPAQPHQGQGTRWMITQPTEKAPAHLTLFGPNEKEITPELKILGGPPYTYYTAPIELEHGEWRAVFGEADDLHACTHIEVRHRPQETKSSEVMWRPQEEWSTHTEALFAAFVERLFQYPLEEDRSWTNLQDLLKVPEQNLLFDHFSVGEEQRLKLQPDCADLPYTLRAYFAWKMRLPFSYMTCTRGSKKKPPQCMDREDSFMPRDQRKLGDDFQWFARKGVAGHVHSASARTVPQDSETELYPVALTREALRPGIVFADPYGHILLVASWSPQPIGGYGVLIGADGQPDGTIGRRRFWEGSFLFDPETSLVGAGFKAFRPLVLDYKKVKERIQEGDRAKVKSRRKKSREKKITRERVYDESLASDWRPLTNEELTSRRMGDLAWSDEQYKGSKRDFYDKMNRLSSPRPVDIKVQLNALADALHESARRRVLSVDNGEGWIKSHPRQKMKMPSGYSIFETSGPWEDFATPSRDMRLLIAIDTVLDLPSALKRTPARFGVAVHELEAALAEVKRELELALRARSFEYTKSDGHAHTLSLWDLTERQAELEMAYNPNDCVEARWGAPKEGDEMKTCRRKAPKDQLRKMDRYRSWFHERKRPPRGTKR